MDLKVLLIDYPKPFTKGSVVDVKTSGNGFSNCEEIYTRKTMLIPSSELRRYDPINIDDEIWPE